MSGDDVSFDIVGGGSGQSVTSTPLPCHIFLHCTVQPVRFYSNSFIRYYENTVLVAYHNRMSHLTRFWHSALNTSRRCGVEQNYIVLIVNSFRNIELNCILVLTNLKMATWTAETCRWLQCNKITFILSIEFDGLCKILILAINAWNM